jgi:Dictyostelium STAT, coiled coil
MPGMPAPGPNSGLGNSVKMEDMGGSYDRDVAGEPPVDGSFSQILSMPVGSLNIDHPPADGPAFPSMGSDASGTTASQLHFPVASKSEAVSSPQMPQAAPVAQSRRPQLSIDVNAPVATAQQQQQRFAPLSPQNHGYFKPPVPTPPTPGQAQSSALLNKLDMFEVAQVEQLRSMRQQQAGVLAAPTNENYNLLRSQQDALQRQIDLEIKSLYDVERTVIMPPVDIERAFYLTQRLQVQATQLELLSQVLPPSSGFLCFSQDD